MTPRCFLLALAAAPLLLTHPTTSVGALQPPAAPERVSSLSITILSTMLADEGFGEWGFAALVEVDGRRILFDTGGNEDTVARNLKALRLDLGGVEQVIFSHNHADHTTGLMPLRRQSVAASPTTLQTLLVGPGIFWPRVAADGGIDDRMAALRRDYEATGGRVTEVARPMRLQPGVWLTGPVPRVHPERNWSSLGKVRSGAGDVEDTVPEDMALVFQTNRGLVFLFGCGHAGVVNTLEHVRKAIDRSSVNAIIGGLHLFAADETHLSWTASQLKKFGVQQIVGAHCTGIEAVYRIRELAGLTRQTCMVGAVGASYSLDKGINPLRVAR
jgi:7,8-dihydropterin-6-yl-methyl-4-(beta-D-ribofuranosyl)aminobenzene 5'-phosphate synthase